MQIVLLDEARFDSFAYNHPNRNLYQSSSYGKIMSKQGHNAYYLGLIDESNNIKAATLIIVKNENANKRKMGYAPRGFLIDWTDDELVKEFSTELKNFLIKRNFTYIKVDPMIVYKEYNTDGTEAINGEKNLSFISKLQSLGYIHLGYNNAYEASNLRWNCITNLNKDIITLYNSISKSARDKIKESNLSGNKVYKGESTDINLLHTIINKNNISIELLLDYYQFYQNKSFEIYFTKLEPASFINTSKTAYEKEEYRNNELNDIIQNSNVSDINTVINEKMKSDSLLAKYKKDMQNAINLFQQYPNGIFTSAVAIVKYEKTVTVIASGINSNFKKQYPNYLLKWSLIQEFARQGYEKIDFNGITKDYNKNEEFKENVELSNKIVEYVGEFDLVINKKSYYTGGKLNPILNWLNTPI